MVASENEDIIKEFLVETYENLDHLEQDLVGLDSEQDPAQRIARIFRTIHTIKGTCGFLGFGHLEHLAHVGESLLSRLRDQKLSPTAEITNALLSTVDAVRAMLSAIEKYGTDGDNAYPELVATLTRLQHVEPAAPANKPKEQPPPPSVRKPAHSHAAEAAASEPPAPLGELLVERGYTTPEAVQRALAAQVQGDPRHVGEILVAQGSIAPADVVDALKSQQQARAAVVDSMIRVDVGLLDKLMNLVGELVLARNQILQFGATRADPVFAAAAQRLNLVTTELQEGVMKTRMQPIDTVWAKLPRVIRDLARTCNKQVTLEMEGKETELDRTLIEAIKDPLTHLVRNAIDHGVESPEARAQAGKPPQGTVRLCAFHEGGRVNIEISDDGNGIDASKIARRALEMRVVSAEELERMSVGEILNLIFRPGFSTAERVTAISGRGVGMDVVKTNIERIGGSVDVESVKGKGTTFKLKIPLTLAIIPALIVGSGRERFAIPQVNLVELVYLEGERARKCIEYVHGAPVYRLRGSLLPLVWLKSELGTEAPAPEGEKPGKSAYNIVVVQADDRQFGLIVDDIHDTEEIVVKPLGKHLKSINVYSGATIMGDGKVALILDVIGLAQRSRVLSKLRDRTRKAEHRQELEELDNRHSLLLVNSGGKHTLGIPLASVSRLEEVELRRIEHAGPRAVVQYRGHIMPLVELAGEVSAAGAAEDAKRPVVVFRNGTSSVGLMVDRIVDIVEETIEPNRTLRRPGISGSAIVQGRVVELVDVAAVLGEFSESAAHGAEVPA